MRIKNTHSARLLRRNGMVYVTDVLTGVPDILKHLIKSIAIGGIMSHLFDRQEVNQEQ